MNRSDLAGLRILVVEDEMLVSLMIEDLLTDERCTIIGPFGRIESALEAARIERLDIALLDVNVAGSKVYPVAEVLAARRIPFLFLSGYGQDAVPLEHPDWRVCQKPFRPADLLGMMQEQMRASRAEQTMRC